MTLPLSMNDLQHHIDDNISVCEQLLAILAQEQDALKSRDADIVETLIDKKVHLLQRLEQSATERESWARINDVDNTEQGWDEVLNLFDAKNLREKWETLKTHYQAIQHQNEINGRLLSRHQKTVTKMLDIMRGKTASPALYTASGYSSTNSHRSRLGEA